MRVVIWNDRNDKADQIQNWFNNNGHNDCRIVIANSYEKFCGLLGTNFDTTATRNAFFQTNLIVSDLCLAVGTDPIEKAQPFHELASRLLDDHSQYPIILFSTNANCRNVVGGDFFDYVSRVTHIDGLRIFQTVWQKWENRVNGGLQ